MTGVLVNDRQGSREHSSLRASASGTRRFGGRVRPRAARPHPHHRRDHRLRVHLRPADRVQHRGPRRRPCGGRCRPSPAASPPAPRLQPRPASGPSRRGASAHATEHRSHRHRRRRHLLPPGRLEPRPAARPARFRCTGSAASATTRPPGAPCHTVRSHRSRSPSWAPSTWDRRGTSSASTPHEVASAAARRSGAQRDERGGVRIARRHSSCVPFDDSHWRSPSTSAWPTRRPRPSVPEPTARRWPSPSAKQNQPEQPPVRAGTCQSLVSSDAGQALRDREEAGRRREPALRPQGHHRPGRRAGHARLRRLERYPSPTACSRRRSPCSVTCPPPSAGSPASTRSRPRARQRRLSGSSRAAAGAFPLTICDAAGQGDHVPRHRLALPDRGHRRRQGLEGRLLVEERLGQLGLARLRLATARRASPTPSSTGASIDLTLTGTPPTITVDGQPGNKINAGPVRSALDTVKGRAFAFPVYDKVTGTGSNTQYRVVGFINLEVPRLRQGREHHRPVRQLQPGRRHQPGLRHRRPDLRVPSTTTASASPADGHEARAAAPSAGRRPPGRRAARRRRSRAPRS